MAFADRPRFVQPRAFTLPFITHAFFSLESCHLICKWPEGVSPIIRRKAQTFFARNWTMREGDMLRKEQEKVSSDKCFWWRRNINKADIGSIRKQPLKSVQLICDAVKYLFTLTFTGLWLVSDVSSNIAFCPQAFPLFSSYATRIKNSLDCIRKKVEGSSRITIQFGFSSQNCHFRSADEFRMTISLPHKTLQGFVVGTQPNFSTSRGLKGTWHVPFDDLQQQKRSERHRKN